MSILFSVDHDFNILNYYKEVPDVILIVEETEIPAHRSVLSEKCEFFRTMFSSSFFEAKSDKIRLKETCLDAFKVILKFIYTGQLPTLYHECQDCSLQHAARTITSQQLFEILLCAQFYMMDDLVNDTISKLKWKCLLNPGLILNNALAYSIDDLISRSTVSIQKEAHDLVKRKVLAQLSPRAWEYVLKLPLDTYESNIFEALVNWMRNNPGHSEAFPKLLEHIELHLLDKAHLDMLFKPTQLIDPLFLVNLLSQQQQQAQLVKKVVDRNVITGADDLRIIDGKKNGSKPTITPLFNKQSIVIDLKQRYLLNCLKLKSEFALSYTISMSTDSQNWDLVIDYSKYECSGRQVLYFTERAVRFIRIQSDSDYYYSVSNIEALYSTNAFSVEIDPETTLIVPNRNLMPSAMLDIGSPYTVRGRIVNGYIEIRNTCSMVYEFRQPYLVGSLKLLLKEVSSYYAEIAYSYRQNWTRVISEENVSGWRIATFERQPVVLIKIVGTMDPNVSEYFRLYGIECPAT
uniref:BTB domain-containing protein n=1 Tax=Panagrellus redivivus TaxID=6233 RepID=A0A7E4UV44_PANRE